MGIFLQRLFFSTDLLNETEKDATTISAALCMRFNSLEFKPQAVYDCLIYCHSQLITHCFPQTIENRHVTVSKA